MERTVSRVLRFSGGVGVHSGKVCALELRPAAARQGIRFARLESADSESESEPLPLSWRDVRASPLCTELVAGAERFQTVEHVMAALVGCGVTNCVVAMEAEEAPIFDGSSAEVAGALAGALQDQSPSQGQEHGRLPVVRVTRRVQHQDADGDRFYELTPLDWEAPGELELEMKPESLDPGRGSPSSRGPRLDVEVHVDSYGGRLSGPATAQYSHEYLAAPSSAFLREVAPARTFAFEEDVARLQEMGLGLGGSLANTVVFRGDGSDDVLNPEGLRFAGDEWARHKLLDVLGDVALCLSSHGALHAHLRATRPGHAATNALLHKLFADPANYTVC